MSAAVPAAADRLDALESRAAEQERTLADLSDVIAAQWRKITALERQLAQTREEFASMGAQRDGLEPPPPHY